MFQWYKSAKVCYVYLSDVPDLEGTDGSSLRECLSASQWFKRGWTLQELLAPVLATYKVAPVTPATTSVIATTSLARKEG